MDLIYCLSSVDKEGFLNVNASPEQRLVRHQQYESYLVEEVVPYINDTNNIDFIIVAGIDLGAYHAINTALKHPGAFGKAIGISGRHHLWTTTIMTMSIITIP